ncbi:MAG: cytidine deaminase, partial [Bacteroidetes bacterium]
AREQAYAPYSHFQVGAALRLADGRILSGGNLENAAYPLCLCAERVVLAAAHALHPGVPPHALAITVHNSRKTIDRPAAPCGACRQVLAEAEARFSQPIRLLLQGDVGPILVFESVQQLLPFGFESSFLDP